MQYKHCEVRVDKRTTKTQRISCKCDVRSIRGEPQWLYAHKSGSSMLRKTEDERLTILIIESLTMGHNAFSVICESGV